MTEEEKEELALGLPRAVFEQVVIENVWDIVEIMGRGLLVEYFLDELLAAAEEDA